MYLATHDKLDLHQDFTEKFKQLQAIGFDAFEIDGAVLMAHHGKIREAVEKTGFPVKMVCGGYGGWIGDFSEDSRQKGLRDIQQILTICGDLGIGGIVVPAAWGMFSLRLPPLTPPRSANEDDAILLDSLDILNNTCGQTNTAVYLEPINRYENHMVVTLSDAARLIDKGRFKNIKITADFFHMNIEEASIKASLERYASYIGHVHIASSQRYEPGTGHIDFVPGFTALKKSGYNGGFSMECRIKEGCAQAALTKSVIFIRDQLRKAGYA